MYVCMYVCILIKLHITALSGAVILVELFNDWAIPLALILPKGDHGYLLRKPLIRRDRGDTLSLLVQFLLES